MMSQYNTLMREYLYSDSYLAHHGVMGMKWGIRRYQPYGVGYDTQHPGKYIGKIRKNPKAKDYQKALNKIERANVKEWAKAYNAKSDYNRYTYWLAKAHNKNSNSKRAQKLTKKANVAYERATGTHDEIEKSIIRRWGEMLKETMDQGYDVVAKNEEKFVRTGNRFVDFLLENPSLDRQYSPERYVNVQTFNVKKAKDPKNPTYTVPWDKDGNLVSVYRKEDLFNSK